MSETASMKGNLIISANKNVSQIFLDHCLKTPNKTAFVVPSLDENMKLVNEVSYSFQDMSDKSAEFQRGLMDAGFSKGDRIVLLMPIGIEFYALMMAIYGLGMVSVFLDPGIGLRKILIALTDSKSKAIVSIHRFLKYRWFLPPLWFMKKISGDSHGFFLAALSSFKKQNTSGFNITPLSDDDHTLITFTSGSTGRAKGTDRNALNVCEQVEVIKKNWACDEGEIDFPTFPMFGLLNLNLGITTVLPAVDFSKISDFDEGTITDQMERHQVTRISGAPKFIGKVIDYAIKNSLIFNSVKKIVLGGASITQDFAEKMEKVFPNAHIKIVYGSTEGAPIAFIDLNEFIMASGRGGLVGKPISQIELRIVKDSFCVAGALFDGVRVVDDVGPFVCDDDEVGEVIISGPHVVKKYIETPSGGSTSTNKIHDAQGAVWHCTGDMGYIDGKGRLWLMGRKTDVILLKGRRIFPYVVEGLLDTSKDVRRSAIVQNSLTDEVCVAIETYHDEYDAEHLSSALKELDLQSIGVKKVSSIPVDDRHNSKIDRVALKKIVFPRGFRSQ